VLPNMAKKTVLAISWLFWGFVFASGQLVAQQAPNLVSPWRGALLESRQGAFYVKVALEGFKSNSLTGYVAGSVQITLTNLISQSTYMFTHRVADIEGFPAEMWRLPSGKYAVSKVELTDMAGKVRIYQEPKPRTFVVARQCLANFGLWKLRPVGNQGLSVEFAMLPNSYTEEGRKSESSVAAVINGESGIVQEVFAGKKRLQNPASDGSDGLRAVVTTTRNISLFYKLDLFKHNHRARDVAAVLNSFDGKIRECYTDALDQNSALKGQLTLQFLLSPQTKTMRKLKPAGGTLSDPKVVECVVLALGQLSFPINETMIGELTYSFDYK